MSELGRKATHKLDPDSPTLCLCSAYPCATPRIVMTKILAIFPLDVSRTATLGLVEKSVGLIVAARRQGFAVDAVFSEDRTLVRFADTEVPALSVVGAGSDPDRLASLRNASFRYGKFWRKLNELTLPPYDYLWVRAFPASVSQATFLRRMLERGTRVVYDLPTYPYELENSSLLRRFWLARSRSIEQIAKDISVFVTLSEHSVIAGRPTITVRNGVDIVSAARRPDERNGPYRLLGLGQWAYWHGLERLFEGIAASGLRDRFLVRLAGEGPAQRQLDRLGKKMELEVEWVPSAYGADRDRLFRWADVGIGGLGIHRKGVYPDQSLKHRQYAAAGLPFIATVADPLWLDTPAVWSMASDDQPVNGSQLLRFCELARQGHAELSEELRLLAGAVSWDAAYSPLWNYFRTPPPA